MDVIDELIACCEAWEPEVCVMGNVRAGEAAKALRGLRADLTMAGAFHKAAVAQRNSAWEEIEHLRAELAEALVWRPISTAPIEGRVLLWRAHGTVPIIARYDPIYGEFEDEFGDHVYGGTHWMPLPAAPVEG